MSNRTCESCGNQCRMRAKYKPVAKASPLHRAATAFEKSRDNSEAFYSELLKLAAPEDQEIIARVLNLDRAFSAFVRRTGDAIEWLLGQQHLAAEPIDDQESEIVKRAAKKFSVTAKAIERAFDGFQTKQVKYLQYRKLWPLKRGV